MKGILFKPDMHLAIREGRKTQTRRLIKPCSQATVINSDGNVVQPDWIFSEAKPRYHIGEVAYIKESIFEWGHCWEPERAHGDVIYKLDMSEHDQLTYGWRSPLFMPAWAARDFIQITEVRPERLQDITEADALAEGITIMQGTQQPIEQDDTGKLKLVGKPVPFAARYQYSALWDSINKKYFWSSNPWVWRYEFKPVPSGKGEEK